MNPDQKTQVVGQRLGQTTVVQSDMIQVDPMIVPAAAAQPSNMPDDTPAEQLAEKPVEKSADKPEHTDKNGKPLLAGYAATDLLEAPERPPQPVETEGKDLTENRKVKLLIAVAIIVFILGLLLLFINLFLGIFVALIAAGIVAFAVFAPVR